MIAKPPHTYRHSGPDILRPLPYEAPHDWYSHGHDDGYGDGYCLTGDQEENPRCPKDAPEKGRSDYLEGYSDGFQEGLADS